MSRPAVIFDRDGTLIDVLRDEETGAIFTAFHPSQLRWLPGAVEGLKLLADAGFVLAVATNQPGVAKGHFSRAALDKTHAAMREFFASHGITLAAIESCMHHPEGGPCGDATLVGRCDCRKPKPGLINTLVDSLDLDVKRTWMVGDALSDVEAARNAGVQPLLVRADKRCEGCPLTNLPYPVRAGTLLELCRYIAGTQGAAP
ncbi:MAG: sugar-phosphatase [Archangium gephyra]|uniref:D,D-heptose 1,7-bisphosphate phosphatase n=1 Tax=Archangium gephyra TaxID=48 RepID=A0A2W5UBQ2_9BACT|nr:MAG: sugar-phosphatase [Archangium gephyra]